MIKASVVALCMFLLGSSVSATRDPATGHSLGVKPTDAWIKTVSPTSSDDIQAAECSHNTRLSDQKFAWFKIDPSKVNQNKSTYGTCFATDTAPSGSQLESDSGYDVFFWQNSGGSSGTGTGPIRDPNTGEPGYEDNSGKFHLGSAPGGGGSSPSSNVHAKTPSTGARPGGRTTGRGRGTAGRGRGKGPAGRGRGTGTGRRGSGKPHRSGSNPGAGKKHRGTGPNKTRTGSNGVIAFDESDK
ncbi:hypothetical protein MJO28_000578 [Puccinia striiformis f. sp. tritici]|uniref:Uncharacterized protein n=2 Tax=Puccinia striiformis TaxID=27350 RepID=A0A2S4U9I0_9BASI|nr:hypothetical protein Pst134EB_001865 [Puccinia striiformis f. sp. tritici]KAI9601124.1 hypothetical protein H4Q26_000925 [Puccinia striiformis f. sp. tritici PST-130]POV93919.1 hypothetical protein PSTT_17124 [Puccinia striiformis]KAI7962484.1 hypothetical protein MJO28_000578 [Puccinia striiformis f. sp. tritici]KAI7967376.1 hypothetical protein MJO29_000653 [Puccinia striiformis f. sp. tritici]